MHEEANLRGKLRVKKWSWPDIADAWNDMLRSTKPEHLQDFRDSASGNTAQPDVELLNQVRKEAEAAAAIDSDDPGRAVDAVDYGIQV